MIARAAIGLAPLAVLCSSAAADPAKLVALTAAPDLRHAIAVGPGGQTYEPDGHGGWARTHEGGIADDVTAATHAGATAFAGVAGGPPFRWANGTWTAVPLALHAKAILGVGPRAVAAVGRTVFALDHSQKLAESPSPVLAVGASAVGLVVATDQGLMRLEHGAWKAIATQGVLLSDRWALADRGAIDLATGRTIAWPDNQHVAVATAVADDTVVGVAGSDLLTLRAGKITREAMPLDPGAVVVAVIADHEGRAIAATRDGKLIVRDHGAWTTTTVRDELPAPRPGAPPATSP